jgi:hypothetical protein
MNAVVTEQVLQWVFAAAPGHPALQEICDHIAANALTRFSNNTNRDTLERTGPGVWTDVVLKHATLHSAAAVRRSHAPDAWLSCSMLGSHVWVCSLRCSGLLQRSLLPELLVTAR